MAFTEYGVNANEAVKLWSRKTLHEALKETSFSDLIGEDSDSIIQIFNETQKHEGDRVRAILRMQLSGRGVVGDSVLKGTEEPLTTYTDDILIDQIRHAVKSIGRVTEQRVPFGVRNEIMMGLRDWISDRLDYWVFNQLSGNVDQTDLAYTGLNTAVSPDANHLVIAGSAGSYANGEASLTATSSQIFTLSIIDKCVLKAQTLTPAIRPSKIMGGAAQYCCWITPEMAYDLQTNASSFEWADLTRAVIQGGNTKNSGMSTGSLGVYKNTLIKVSWRLPTFTGNTRGRAVFAGAQAAGIAFGKGYGPSSLDWVEELDDYKNRLGVALGLIAGCKKFQFNNADLSTITVGALHSEAAQGASGR